MAWTLKPSALSKPVKFNPDTFKHFGLSVGKIRTAIWDKIRRVAVFEAAVNA